jgi:hypothetical protein
VATFSNQFIEDRKRREEASKVGTMSVMYVGRRREGRERRR